jgi:hypothetical protein
MKLKNMIIDNEYDNAFPFDKEYTDWIMSMEYDYSETTAPSKLAVTNKTVLHLDNIEEYSPYATANS